MSAKTPRYHHLQLAISGYSGAGKTTLISKVIKKLSADYNIGYIKHDAHRFEMDYEGKDTHVARSSGASQVFINDPRHYAHQHWKEPHESDVFYSMIACDFVLIEGRKHSQLPKIVVIDPAEKILAEYKNNQTSDVLAFVGAGPRPEGIELPYFHRDDVAGISDFILQYLQARAKKPLYGLVLGGGKSSRMGQDKGALAYHGVDQIRYSIDLMSDLCEEVFVSCRAEQKDEAHLKNFAQIHDVFLNKGPLGGILSAFDRYPQASWLVVACDLPFLTKQTLRYLVDMHNPFSTATAYKNAQHGWAEPLCTIYNPKAHSRLLQFLALGHHCPRKTLMNSPVQLLDQQNQQSLNNVNTPHEALEATQQLVK